MFLHGVEFIHLARVRMAGDGDGCTEAKTEGNVMSPQPPIHHVHKRHVTATQSAPLLPPCSCRGFTLALGLNEFTGYI